MRAFQRLAPSLDEQSDEEPVQKDESYPAWSEAKGMWTSPGLSPSGPARIPLEPSKPKSAAERERRRLLAELKVKQEEEARREKLSAASRARAESRRGALGGRRASLLRKTDVEAIRQQQGGYSRERRPSRREKEIW